ncbi:hypothetical protein HY388_01565 [Candidatus Daviesbacteria bacterium]|nr:hypothetical protein [Candidatus Daviesbacteria bacterium]
MTNPIVDFITATFGITLGDFIKWSIAVFLVFNFVISLIIIRQVQLMDATFSTGLGPVLKVVAFFYSVLVFLTLLLTIF